MRKVLLMTLGILLAVGCGDSETSFDVDPNDVAPAQVDSLFGVSFQPPRDFQIADPDFLQRARRQMLRTPAAGERFFIVPTMIFAVPESDARCFLSEFPNIGAAKFDQEWRQMYLEEARRKATGQTVSAQEVTVLDVPMLEIEIQSPQSLNRRYVFQSQDGRFFQIDYLIPAEMQAELLPRVASSVGSIRLF